MEITLYMTQTLNGIIADAEENTPWSGATWKAYYALAKKFPAIIVGRRTYDVMREVNEFKKIGDPLIAVLSRKKIRDAVSSDSARTLRHTLRKQGVKKALLGGGARANLAFLKAGLVDRVIIDIEPLVLSSGVTFLPSDKFAAELKLVKMTRIGSQVVRLEYKII